MERMEDTVEKLQREDAGLKEQLAQVQGKLETFGDGRSAPNSADNPGLSGLVARLQGNGSNDLSPSCKKAAKPVVQNVASVLHMQTEKAESSLRACPGELKLMEFGSTGVTETCCPITSKACTGCASFGSGTCQRCSEGFLFRDGMCVACASSAGWLSQDGKACPQLAHTDCNDVKVRGQSSNEACCQCGGGVLTPSPFIYPNRRWSLDSNIIMQPEPRTADHYSLDAKCELPMYNLTMDWAIAPVDIEHDRKTNLRLSSKQYLTMYWELRIATQQMEGGFLTCRFS